MDFRRGFRWAAAGSVLVATSLGLSILVKEPPHLPPEAREGRQNTPDTPQSAAWQREVIKRIRAGEYAIRADGSTGLRAFNRALDAVAHFDGQGLELEHGAAADRDDEAGERPAARSTLRLGLTKIGRVGATAPLETGATAPLATGATAPLETGATAPLATGAFALGACRADGALDERGQCLRRAERKQAAFTEWWENRPEGLEHGFDVARRPAGKGELELQIAVDGLVTIDADGRGATFSTGLADGLRYAALSAVDADGRALAASMRAVPGGLAIVVDDRDARYPVVIDPLLTSKAWSVTPDQASALFGWSVNSAGDVNGDGFGDVIVGAYGHDKGQTDEGCAFVYHGSASGLSLVAAWTGEGNQNASQYGWSVAGAGDVNGDGFGDVIVGAPKYNNGSAATDSDEGMVFVYHGSASGLAVSPAFSDDANTASATLGIAVSSAGDVDNDGYADVIVGMSGAARVYYGSSTGLAGSTPAPGSTVTGSAANHFGNAVAAAGDVNGDGYGDVIVGTPDSAKGTAQVYHGSMSGLSTTAAWTVNGPCPTTACNFGIAVSGAGDINGDGYGDIIVGAYKYTGTESQEGAAFAFMGSASGLSTTASSTLQSDQATAFFGISVGGAGDVNGDGFGDVIIGASQFNGGLALEGGAFVYLGSAAGLAATSSWSAKGEQENAQLGRAVAGAGDVNGDGFSDVIVGVFGFDDGQVSEGLALVYHGSAAGPETTASWSEESGQANAELGTAVANAGDVNGDGFGDVIVGAPNYDSEGAAFVYLGQAAGLAASANWTGSNGVAGSHFGSAVAAAGDVDGDGYGDVIVGAPDSSAGNAYVYHGSASGVEATATRPLSGQASSKFGTSVAGAGDVNGDGYGDIIVGAPLHDNGETNEGAAFVHLGSNSGIAASSAATLENNQAGSAFGSSVASAGDVNRDGFGDVLVGAPNTANGNAYAYLGNANGVSTSASWTVNGGQATSSFGCAVAGAGDVNGDGYSDVVVGASAYDKGQTDEGAAFVYLGGSSGLATSSTWTGESDQGSAAYGGAVASAGDVNGDGYGDVVVGASNYNKGQAGEGAAFLYLGSASGLTTSSSWTGESDQASAAFGQSVASAGDVNGDGYADLLVGAGSFSNGQSHEGAAFLFLGNGGDDTGAGKTLRPQARRPGTSTPVAAYGRSSSYTAVDIATLSAKGAMGQTRAKLEVEVKALTAAFTGSGLVRSGAWTNTTVSGASITTAITNLTSNSAYHYRARLVFDPARSAAWQRSRWLYGGVSGQARGVHLRTAPCAAGTAGPSCQYSNAVTCNGHGTAQYNGSCTCSAGFAGATCNQCATGYQAPACDQCAAGYAGASCQYSDAVTCNGHGTAQANGSCTCNLDYVGTGCQYSDALTCNNNGAAQPNGSCVCESGFAGASCQYSDASTCSRHGEAQSNGSCTCDTGFSGTSCNACASNYYAYPSCVFCSAGSTCSGHGTCNASGECSCSSAYTGSSCASCAADHYGASCTYCVAAITCGGHGTCNGSGACACSAGYAGSGCQYSDALTCNGHGTAQANGSCTCSGGFTGAQCQFGDAGTCNGHGTAQPSGGCTCNTGYVGSACQYGDATTCNGHGTAQANGSCVCASGYAGTGCQYGDALTCNNHGQAKGDGSCTCDAAFSGTKCSACASNHYGYPSCTYCLASDSCSGAGTCDSDGSCACSSGALGAKCQYSDAKTCNGHGAAQPDGSCLCDSGHIGGSCQYSDSETCHDFGKVQADGSCVCETGHLGDGCQFSDATTCANHGTVHDDGSCTCSATYAGEGCQFSDASTCDSNGAAQDDGTCSCEDGYHGPTCSRGDGPPCGFNGVASGSKCTCDANYAGAKCQYGDRETCNGNGTALASGACECDDSFAGSACQFGDQTTCSGHGTARDDGSCRCESGFGGDACQRRESCSGHGKQNASGDCSCDQGFAGASCQKCAPGFSGYPDCGGENGGTGDGSNDGGGGGGGCTVAAAASTEPLPGALLVVLGLVTALRRRVVRAPSRLLRGARRAAARH